jgi:uncharacterized RDD family membrane protein YckC
MRDAPARRSIPAWLDRRVGRLLDARWQLETQESTRTTRDEVTSMSVDNPYTAPEAELIRDPEPTGPALADRGTRFVAAFLDGIIGMVIGIPLLFVLGEWDYVMKGQQPPFRLVITGGVLGILGFLLIHGYFLKTNGQTVGKKAQGIRIANLDDTVPSFGRVIGMRYLPIWIVSFIPVVGMFLPTLDILFIFRGDRRCIHDLIAGTKVVKVK